MLQVVCFQSFLDMFVILGVLVDHLTCVSLPELHILGVVFGKYKSFVVHYVVVDHSRQSYLILRF
jgi:hypothetical protein